MNFDWKRYITLAEVLYREADMLGDREACLRSSISRAYYGVYGLARELAMSQGKVKLTKSALDHGLIISYFRNASERKHRRIGVELDRLRRARNQADYEDRYQDLDKQAQLALQRARRIESMLS